MMSKIIKTNKLAEKTDDPNQDFLKYYFTPPSVIVSEGEPSKPVVNEVLFSIQNRLQEQQIQFLNTDHLKSDDALPSYGDSAEKFKNLSVFFIYFPYGDGETDFVTLEAGWNITVSPVDPDAWNCVKETSADIGTYWKLFPSGDIVLNPRDQIKFKVSNIISFNAPATSYMYINNRNVQGFNDKTVTCDISLEKADLNIVSFQAVPGTIGKGRSSTLLWEVSGAYSCTLDPGNELVNPVDKKVVTADQTMNYTLTAKDREGKVKTSTITLYVVKPVINLFAANISNPVNAGDPVTLSWDTSFASSCEIDQNIGAVQDSGQITVHPSNNTKYTLTCQGLNEPVFEYVSISVNSVEIKSFTIDPIVTDSGQDAVLTWEVNNATDASIDHEIGAVAIPKGSSTVNPQRDINYTLTCYGPNGPVHSTVNLQVNCVKITKFTVNGYAADLTTSGKKVDLRCDGTLNEGYSHTDRIEWSTERATSVKLIDSEGGVVSTAPSGSYEIDIPSGTAEPVSGTVTLVCEGPGGPISKSAYYN